MPFLNPFIPTVLLLIALLIYIGVAHQVMDRMRLNRRTAGLLVLLMGLGTFSPDIPLGTGISVNPGGALIPLGVAVYLVASADQAVERTRAYVAVLVTAALVLAYDVLLPLHPLGRFDLDPVYVPGILAGIVAYLLGRSRRAAFVAGVGGVILADLVGVVINALNGVPGALVAVGGAGLIDSVVMAAIIAVLLAEAVGETRERLARGGDARPTSPDAIPARGDSTAGIMHSPHVTMLLVGVSLAAIVSLAYHDATRTPMPGDELSPDAALEVVNRTGGELLTMIARQLSPDDLYISGDGITWRVTEVTAGQALVEAARQVDGSTSEGASDEGQLLPTDLTPVWAASAAPEPGTLQPGPGALVGQVGIGDIFPILEGDGADPQDVTEPPIGQEPEAVERPGPIGIYHTHNAESYLIGDGTSSIYGEGGIHVVGAAMSEALEQQGFEVLFEETLHLPHDRGAYRRSRRTVANLLQQQPIALFDVHRDATAPEFYAHQLEDGTQVTRVRLVVGTGHVNYERNMAFARALQNQAEELYPGLVLDIFAISGTHFNQDVGRHAILLEVGAHTNARDHAVAGIRRFAEVVAAYFTTDE